MWTDECDRAFQLLKQKLTSAPILVIPDPNRHFTMITDASGDSLGGVLMQEGRVVAYESHKLKQHEVKNVPHDLELAAIVHALQMWRHYLIGKPFELKTDHMGLRYIFTQPNWLEFLSEYDFGIEYIKGKENRVADALSRRRHIFTISTTRTRLKEHVIKNLKGDDHYEMVKTALHTDPSDHRFDGYSFDIEGLLRYQGRMYIPNHVGLRKIVMEEMHSTPYSGHPGVTKMVADMRPLYFWPGLKRDVTVFVAQCL